MKDAENYIRVFTGAKPEELKCLNLGFHGTKHSECKVYVFRLLQIYIVKNPLLSQTEIGKLVMN